MIRNLRPQQLVLLSRGAIALSLRRLKNILKSADPADRPLKHLLGLLIAEEEETAAVCRRLDWKAPASAAETSELDAILDEYFPSAGGTFGEGRLHREAALYFSEMLASDRASFFEAVSQATASPEARTLFAGAHEASLRRVEHLRSVIL